MANEILPNLQIQLPDVGADTDNWGNILNDDLRLIDRAVQVGIVSKTLSNADVTLTQDEAAKSVILVTGTLTANVSVIVPTTPTRVYVFDNRTTGNFSVTVKTATGAGVVIGQGQKTSVFSDGVNVLINIDFKQPGLGSISRSVASKLQESVSVKDFGAVGDGVADDTAAIQAAIAYAKSLTVYNNGENTAPRGGFRIYFPKGLYLIGSTIQLSNINGLVFSGDGKESSMLVYTPNTGSMFNINQMLFTTFEKLGFATGIIGTNTASRKTVTVRSANRVANLFNWTSESGSDRFNVWRDIFVKGGFDKVWDVAGSTTHSENSIVESNFFDCNYVWYSNNVQSVNTYFSHCDAEFIQESVFYYVSGGNLYVCGGSYINPKDFLTFATGAGLGINIGTSNYTFSFESVRWEMYENIDNTKTPKIVNCVNGVLARLEFSSCTMLSGSNAKSYFTFLGDCNSIFINCSLFGLATATPQAGRIPKLVFNKCAGVPTVTRNLDNGTRYRVRIVDCGNGADLLFNQDNNNTGGSLTFSPNTYRTNINALLGSATTFSFTRPCPTGFFYGDYFISVGRGGGVGITANVYLDAAKTVLLFTQNLGANVGNNLWSGTISYTGQSSGGFTSSGTLYIDLVTQGNAGVVDFNIYLNYIN